MDDEHAEQREAAESVHHANAIVSPLIRGYARVLRRVPLLIHGIGITIKTRDSLPEKAALS
jgi:hypothetical protein